MQTIAPLLRALAGLAFLYGAAAPAGLSLPSYSVGSGPECDFSNPQDAIDAAAADGVRGSIVRIAGSFFGLELEMSADTVLIDGGYADCSGRPDKTRAILSGAGGSAAPVLRITGDSWRDEQITLRNLEIRNGDPPAGVLGGGIQHLANAALLLENVRLEANRSDRGGGIYLDGGLGASLAVDAESAFLSNEASQAGGALFCRNLIPQNVAIVEAPMESNSAVNGGAIYAENCPVHLTELASARFNDASGSGGLAYLDDAASLVLLGGAEPLPIWQNRAGLDGGAVYLTGSSALHAENVAFLGNDASRDGGFLFMDSGSARLGASDECRASRCSTVTSGTAQRGGAVYQLGGQLVAEKTWFQGNGAPDGSLIKSEGGSLEFDSVVASGHYDATAVLRLKNGAYTIRFSTFAGNSDMGNTILMTGGSLELEASIIWESVGVSVGFFGDPTSTTLSCLLLHNYPLSLSQPDIVIGEDPQFVDPCCGDYHLRATSPAVDFCDARVESARRKAPFQAFDIDQQQRGEDFPDVVNRLGAYDLGADEVTDALFGDGFES